MGEEKGGGPHGGRRESSAVHKQLMKALSVEAVQPWGTMTPASWAEREGDGDRVHGDLAAVKLAFSPRPAAGAQPLDQRCAAVLVQGCHALISFRRIAPPLCSAPATSALPRLPPRRHIHLRESAPRTASLWRTSKRLQSPSRIASRSASIETRSVRQCQSSSAPQSRLSDSPKRQAMKRSSSTWSTMHSPSRPRIKWVGVTANSFWYLKKLNYLRVSALVRRARSQHH